MTRIEYHDGLGPDFVPALIAAFPDRDPSQAEITVFEREYRRRRERLALPVNPHEHGPRYRFW